jgi:putative ABC transport system permease protein
MQTVRLSVLEAREHNATTLDGAAGYADSQFTWQDPDGPERVAGGAVGGDLFPLLGATMSVGRGFADSDAPMLPVVLSHGFWQRRFGGRRDVVGETLQLDGLTGRIASSELVQPYVATARLRSAQPRHVQLELPERDYPEQARRLQLQRALLEKVRALPGVDAAATTSALPLGTIGVGPVAIEGREKSGEPTWAGVQAVDSAYFGAVRSRISEGRNFAASDVAGSGPVVVVNETFAKRYLAGREAVGARVSITPTVAPSLRVVGVVEDVKHAGLSWDYLPEIFVPYEQISEGPVAAFLGATLAVVLRAPEASAPGARVLRETVGAIDSTLPLIDVATGAQLVQRSAKSAEFRAWVIAGSAVLSILLAALGLYGVLARSVLQRRRELGIRMALGATAPTLFGNVCGAGLALGAVGVAIGLVVVIAAGGALKSLLFGVTAIEPGALGGTALGMLVAAAAASVGPAWRAVRMDPTAAIKGE